MKCRSEGIDWYLRNLDKTDLFATNANVHFIFLEGGFFYLRILWDGLPFRLDNEMKLSEPKLILGLGYYQLLCQVS